MLLHGLKAWWISPKVPSAAVQRESKEHTTHPCSWMEKQAPAGLTFCVQQAGDIIHLSDEMFHATCNLDDFVLGIGAQGRIPLAWSPFDRDVHRGLIPNGAMTGSPLYADRSIPEGSGHIHKAAQKNFSNVVAHLLTLRVEPGQNYMPSVNDYGVLE